MHLPDNIVLESLHLKMENEISSSISRILIMFGMQDKLNVCIFTKYLLFLLGYSGKNTIFIISFWLL